MNAEPIEPTEPWNELLAGYVLGDLTPEEAVLVKAYLAAHPNSMTEVKALQSTLSLLPLALPETAQPPPLKTERLRQAEAPTLKALKGRTPRRLQAVIVLGGMGLSLLSIGLGWESYRLRQELAATQTRLAQVQNTAQKTTQNTTNSAAHNSRFFTLKAATEEYSASGSLVVIPTDEQVLLNIQNLQPLPSGKVYRLWALNHGKQMKCADFNTNAKGQVTLDMPLDHALMETPLVLITIEPSQSDVQLQGSAVMVGKLLI